jgi:hypothetical protein
MDIAFLTFFKRRREPSIFRVMARQTTNWSSRRVPQKVPVDRLMEFFDTTQGVGIDFHSFA